MVRSCVSQIRGVHTQWHYDQKRKIALRETKNGKHKIKVVHREEIALNMVDAFCFASLYFMSSHR